LVFVEAPEAVDVHLAIHGLPTAAQFIERTHAQAAESQDAAWSQNTRSFFQHLGKMAAPLDGQAGKDEM